MSAYYSLCFESPNSTKEMMEEIEDRYSKWCRYSAVWESHIFPNGYRCFCDLYRLTDENIKLMDELPKLFNSLIIIYGHSAEPPMMIEETITFIDPDGKEYGKTGEMIDLSDLPEHADEYNPRQSVFYTKEYIYNILDKEFGIKIDNS